MKGAAGKLGDILAGVGKTAAVGVAAAGTALTALTKQTLDAVGSFEQLEGGAQKSFDEIDFEKISRDAKNAYKELNMSAIEYLESINLAGATFAQTMGDEKGYDTARKGMLSIADYASGTGRNLTELNQKYQMITRSASSYQSIADQFSGILPATSAEFLEQAKAAGFLSNTYEKLTEVPVAEYQQALTNMLEYGVNKLGLSNNTLRESTETLTGSFAMASAAWKNFLTGQGTTRDFVGAFTSAIDQTKGKLNEIIPRLTEGLTEIVDLISPEIPSIIEQTLPAVITGASGLVSGLASRLPELLTATLPALANGVVDVTAALVGVMPELVSSFSQSIPIVVQTIWSKKDELIKAGGELIDTLIPSDPKGLMNKAFDVLDSFLNAITSKQALDMFFDGEHGAVKIIGALADGLVEFSVNLGESAIIIIKNIGDYLNDEENRKQIFDSAKDIVINIGKGLTSQEAKDALGGFVVESAKFIADVIVGGIDWDASGGEIARKIISGLFERLKEISFIGLGENISSYIADSLGEKIENNPLLNPQVIYAERDKPKVDHSQLTELARDAYNNAHKHSTGFLATRPTWLTNNVVGENGAEALLPLENNTGWMDKLADKLGSKMNGSGDIYITINAPTGNADDIVNAIDEAFRNRQIAQDRSTGGTGWK